MARSSTADRAALESRRVEKVYSVLARVYDAGFDWALGPGRRLAVGRLPARAGERVLEVGVGTGLSLPHYPEGCRVTGIDISEPMLEQARERRMGHPRKRGRHKVQGHRRRLCARRGEKCYIRPPA